MTPPIDAALERTCQDPLLGPCHRQIFRIPGSPPSLVPLPADLHPAVRRTLDRFGFPSLYGHQAEALERFRAGENLFLCTPTASGKTWAFLLPLLEALARDEEATAMLFYPLKALSQDQWTVLQRADRESGLELQPAVYDGDTPRTRRPRIRQESRVVLTNPYEMHEALAYHHQWHRFFSRIRMVVVDEAHRYTGLFGSHVAQVFRRLDRVIGAHGGRPGWVLASASIANPAEHARALTGRPASVIDRDGAGAGPRILVFWDGGSPEGPSPFVLARTLLCRLVEEGLKTLCFTQSRRGAEWIASLVAQDRRGRELPIAPYRAGYLPEERRALERDFREGRLRGVVSTTALELGIDVGDLDAVIVAGWPGSQSGFWQQVGRAGRRGGPSLGIFLAFPDILDQYLLHHPEMLLDRAWERATIDLRNPHVVAGHLLCAATELPVQPADDPLAAGMAEGLARQGLLRRTSAGFVHGGLTRPQDAVRLDRIGDRQVVLEDALDGSVLETLDLDRALREAFPGAIYLHGGRTWRVEHLDLPGSRAVVRRQDVDYWTVAITDKTARSRPPRDRRSLGPFEASLGDLEMTWQVTGYLRKRHDHVIGREDLDLPQRTFQTVGIRLDLAPGPRPGIEDLLGALHALEHVLVGLAPLALHCDPADLAGFSTLVSEDTGGPAVFLYDGWEGGIGLSERAFQDLPRMIRMAREVLGTCRCEKGCPSCCLSPRCGNDNQPMDKAGALALVREIPDP
ncbi:DEAD/DEAH box helicase [Myxococcota bacterium]|nr:DEAD/DEAH box helicase [Myxococcota bacterium]